MIDDALGKGGERLNIEVVEEKETVIFRLRGRLDIFTYLELKKRMDPYLENSVGKYWVVDLSEVPFVASSGWSVFIATRSRLKRNNSKIALVGLAFDLQRIYQAMRMTELVPAYATLSEARQHAGPAA